MERQKEFGYKTVANGRERNINSSRFKIWSQYRKRLKFYISQLLHSFFTIHIFFWCIELQKCYFLNLHYSFCNVIYSLCYFNIACFNIVFILLLLQNKKRISYYCIQQVFVKYTWKSHIILIRNGYLRFPRSSVNNYILNNFTWNISKYYLNITIYSESIFIWKQFSYIPFTKYRLRYLPKS